MRLHLPKRLLHAVLTALVTTSAALFTLGSNAYGDIEAIDSDTSKASSGTYEGFNVSNNATLKINNGLDGSSTANGGLSEGATVTLGPTKVEAGSKLYLWCWTTGKFTYVSTDKVTIAGNITLEGTNTTAATLYMQDGSYNFSGDITVVNKGVIESNYAKGNIIQSLKGNSSAALTFQRNNNDTGAGLFYLAGANDYAGTVTLLNNTSDKPNAWNNLVIGHADALKNAAVDLGTTGAATGNVRNALELNVASASIRALSGVGTVRLRSLPDGTSGVADITSAALTITGSDNGVFSGTIAEGVDLVIGENASQTFSGASIGSTITNNGSLTIESSYTGGTIIQGEKGALSLASGTVINLDSLTYTYNLADGNGIQDYTISWTLASGGTVVDDGATYALSGNVLAGTMLSGTFTSSESECYMITSESVNYSNITATGQPTFDFICVAGDGVLVADAAISHDLVSSGGSTESLAASGGFVKVDGTGISYSGAMDLVQGSNLTITKADNRTDPAGMTINGVISGAGGLIVSGGVTVTLAADNTFTGGITVKNGSTLKLSGVEKKEYCGVGGNSVTVESGATFDLNGTHSQERLPAVTLAGGTLTSTYTGAAIETNKRQLDGITLTADSEIKATSRFGLVRSMYDPATISLGAYTLTKTGTSQFDASSTSVTGTGKIRIEGGTFNFHRFDATKAACSLGNGVGIELAGGALSGEFENTGTSTIHAATSGTVSATITNSGTLKVTGAEGKTVTFSGVINGGDVETSAATSIATMTGSGKLKTTAKTTTVTNASGFTGTLEATGGQMNVSLATSTAKELVGLTAVGGDINVTNALSLTVADVVISNDSTVGVYSGADKGTLNVCGSDTNKCSLTIGSGATLNANLVVNLAILDFSGNALAMGSTLTLIANGTSELRGISALSAGQSLTLFTGVGSFSTSWDPSLATTDVVTVDAHEIFGNLTTGTYSLKYTGGTDRSVLLIANNPTPEPTTATLSLLALMGLAARRRRKA